MYRPGSLAVSQAGNVVLADADDILVAIVSPVTHQRASGDHFHKPDLEASRLFAAAPDMLAALQWFLDFCDEHQEWTETSLCNGRVDSAESLWLASARAAIAKAKGE